MNQVKLQIPNNQILNVFGEFDFNIKIIERHFDVIIVNRGEDILITGTSTKIDMAHKILNSLLNLSISGKIIDEQKVNYLISELENDKLEEAENVDNDMICLTVGGKPVKPKTIGQKKYISLIKENTVTFGIGPAGTGKTYLAMAMAITAFKNNLVDKIILTRPAIEAGEHLGFLPGDLQQKVDPYLRPLYDALYEIMGSENFQINMDKALIEVAPLAYMRGRTLDNAFIVLDEAQNTTPEQMKMFLTRIGFGSKVVITGDLTQIDLPTTKNSGLLDAIKILKDIYGIGIYEFSSKDVVRHPLVQKIINAYEKLEKQKAKNLEHLKTIKNTQETIKE